MPNLTSPTEPSDAEIIAAYTSGRTVEEIVATCGLSYRQVRSRLLDAEVTMRPQQRQVQPTPPGLVEAYQSGLSIRATGAQFGLSYSATRNMLLRAGTSLRSRGQEPAFEVRS
jgi:hypothetical protein